MIDFTLKSYEFYLKLIKKQYDKLLTFSDYFSYDTIIDEFCILRHDVDRKPKNALRMAKMEKDYGISATYFFRTKKNIMDKKIISEINKLGHEIGYHYESLSDQNGNMNLAIKDFEHNLQQLRNIVPIHTISMHGRPLSSFDNRDMWKDKKNHQFLKSRYGIQGEVYLDIDYHDIAYISDTGRNWCTNTSNIRDHVNSNVQLDLYNQRDLIAYLQNPHPQLILLIHPERWHNDFYGYSMEFLRDKLINCVKYFL